MVPAILEYGSKHPYDGAGVNPFWGVPLPAFHRFSPVFTGFRRVGAGFHPIVRWVSTGVTRGFLPPKIMGGGVPHGTGSAERSSSGE